MDAREEQMTLDEQLEGQISKAESLEALTEPLAELLGKGYEVWHDGRLMVIKVLVARVNGLRIEIRVREHAPPHFHLSGDSIDASFSVADCTLIEGHIDPRHERLIKWWFQRSQPTLVEIWNKTRPTDCPVGLWQPERR